MLQILREGITVWVRSSSKKVILLPFSQLLKRASASLSRNKLSLQKQDFPSSRRTSKPKENSFRRLSLMNILKSQSKLTKKVSDNDKHKQTKASNLTPLQKQLLKTSSWGKYHTTSSSTSTMYYSEPSNHLIFLDREQFSLRNMAMKRT